MKQLAIATLLTATAIAPTQALAAKCHSGQMGFQELVYSSKSELVREYCLAENQLDLSDPGSSASIGERMAYSDQLDACADYFKQMAKVLRKEHNLEPNTIKCK